MPTNTTPPMGKDSDDHKEEEEGSSSSSSNTAVFSSWTTWFDELSDRQRLDRLRSCSELDQILKSCQENSARQQQRQQQTHIGDNMKQQQQNQQVKTTTGSRWSLWNRSSHQSQQQQQQQQQEVPRTADPAGTNVDGVSHIDLIERTSQGIRSMKYFGWRGVLLPSSSNSDSTNNENETTAVSAVAAGSSNRNNDTPTDIEKNERNDVMNRMIRQSCSREQHAVWACRAVATGCGHDLSLLKTCFEKGGEDENGDGGGGGGNGNKHCGHDGQHRKFSTTDILTTPHTAYHLGGVGGGGGVELKSKKNNGTMDKNIPCYDQQVRLGHCVTAQAQALLERKRRREGAGTK